MPGGSFLSDCVATYHSGSRQHTRLNHHAIDCDRHIDLARAILSTKSFFKNRGRRRIRRLQVTSSVLR